MAQALSFSQCSSAIGEIAMADDSKTTRHLRRSGTDSGEDSPEPDAVSVMPTIELRRLLDPAADRVEGLGDNVEKPHDTTITEIPKRVAESIENRKKSGNANQPSGIMPTLELKQILDPDECKTQSIDDAELEIEHDAEDDDNFNPYSRA